MGSRERKMGRDLGEGRRKETGESRRSPGDRTGQEHVAGGSAHWGQCDGTRATWETSGGQVPDICMGFHRWRDQYSPEPARLSANSLFINFSVSVLFTQECTNKKWGRSPNRNSGVKGGELIPLEKYSNSWHPTRGAKCKCIFKIGSFPLSLYGSQMDETGSLRFI